MIFSTVKNTCNHNLMCFRNNSHCIFARNTEIMTNTFTYYFCFLRYYHANITWQYSQACLGLCWFPGPIELGNGRFLPHCNSNHS